MRRSGRRLLIVLLLCGAIAYGQRARGGIQSNGAQIQVRIVNENNRPVNLMLLVELLQGGGGFVVTQVRSNTDGSATLAMPAGGGGNFRLRISGMGIETTTSDLFTMDSRESSHFEVVKVKLNEQTNAANNLPGGLASATDLSVPGKARKEFDAGVASLRATDWKGAATHFEAAIKSYPKFDRAWYGLGLAKQNDGDVPGAKEAYQKALDINDHNADALRDLGRMDVNEQKWAEAETLLVKSVAIDPTSAAALTLLAIAQIQQHKIDEAIANASRVHALSHKSYALAHFILARAYEAKSDSEKAIAEYKLFLEEEPTGVRAEDAKKQLARLEALR